MTTRDLPGLVCISRLDRGYAEDGSPDEVYLARWLPRDVEVAVRVYVRPFRTERDRARFDRETAALKGLAGVPHLMAIHETGVSPYGHPYLVTDFCAAGSLADHLDTVGRFTPTEVRRIGAKLAGALAVAHARHVFHRNLRPAAVLVDYAGEPVLADFGLVSVAVSDGHFALPPPAPPRPFVAPEAYLPELMAVAADIYALGATLYTLLAGAVPTVHALAMAVDGETIADLPKVPWDLMAVIRRAMAHDPRDRHPTATALQSALT